MRRLRPIIVGFASALVAFGLPTAALAASGLSLTKHRITFTGQMTTTWAQLPHEVGSSDPYCWTGSESGQGTQTVRFRTTGAPTLSVTSDSSSYGPFFQILPVSRRAAPDRVSPGFGLARINRNGSLVTTYSAALNTPGICDPPPPPESADESDCGAYAAPWDVQFQVRKGILFLAVEALPKARPNCPFFEPNVVGQDARQASFPSRTTKRVGNIRKLLAPTRGKGHRPGTPDVAESRRRSGDAHGEDDRHVDADGEAHQVTTGRAPVQHSLIHRDGYGDPGLYVIAQRGDRGGESGRLQDCGERPGAISFRNSIHHLIRDARRARPRDKALL